MASSQNNYRNIIIFIFIMVAFLAVINKQIIRRMSPDTPAIAIKSDLPQVPAAVDPKIKQIGRLTKELFLDPNRTFYIASYFNDGEKFSECKISGHDVHGCTHVIPNGKFEFKNVSDQTHGVVNYRNGNRDGLLTEYYHNGQIKRQATYAAGEVRTTKEYFFDGILRMEQDFSDALRFVDDSEVGVGKVYRREGTLMYEWRLTNKDRGGYKRSYDKDGLVVSIRYFDENGHLTSSESYR